MGNLGEDVSGRNLRDSGSVPSRRVLRKMIVSRIGSGAGPCLATTMSTSVSSFLVPLTFSNSNYNYQNDLGRNLLEESCSNTRPSVMKSWRAVRDHPLDAGMDVDGVLFGSHDGTLYVFKQARPNATSAGPTSQFYPSRPTSPLRLSRDSRGPSRSSTPSLTSPSPFNVTPRSRIVSGITTERVEAPKNYVDFEDEPGKLKEMLKGRNPKEKLAVSDAEPTRGTSVEKTPASSLLGPPNVGLKRKHIPKALLSPTHSPSLTSNSLPSASEQLFSGAPHDLSLWCHIIPPRSGPGRAVTSIRFINSDNEIFAALQETGLVISRPTHKSYFLKHVSVISLYFRFRMAVV